ncbi:MAG: hypothetical protein R3F48_17075 [Candidatus Zixiibacteriota bacterium]
MKKNIALFLLSGLILFLATSCKKTHFTIAEEVHDNVGIRYTTKTTWYTMGKSIVLTQGKYQLIPSDSVVLYVEGESTGEAVSESAVAELKLAKTARFYFTLPRSIKPGRYDTGFKSICELMGSVNYGVGENLFTCQSGHVVIDSLRGEEVFGSIEGTYRNTRSQSLKLDGSFRAKPH